MSVPSITIHWPGEENDISARYERLAPGEFSLVMTVDGREISIPADGTRPSDGKPMVWTGADVLWQCAMLALDVSEFPPKPAGIAAVGEDGAA